MSNITTNSNREKIWDALILAGLTPQGAAGVWVIYKQKVQDAYLLEQKLF